MIKSAPGAMFAILAAISMAPSLARTLDHPTYSSTIALSADNKLVWSVNTADNSVSVISTASNSVIKKIAVGKEPQSIALDPDNRYAYVANAADSTVTVIKIEESEPPELEAAAHGVLTTGAEPWNIVASPDVDAEGILSFTDGKSATKFIDLNDPSNPATRGANAGKNPLGIVITDNGKTAYVQNFVSRNVSVVDLTRDQVAKVIRRTAKATPVSNT